MANRPGSIEFETPSEQNRQFSGKVKINSILVKVFQGQTCIQSDVVNQLDWPEETVQESCKDFFEDEHADKTSLPEEEINQDLEAEQLSEASVKVNHVNVDIIQCPVEEWQAESGGQTSYKQELQDGHASESSLPDKEKKFVQENDQRNYPSNTINHVSFCVDQYPDSQYQKLFIPCKQLKQVTKSVDILKEAKECPADVISIKSDNLFNSESQGGKMDKDTLKMIIDLIHAVKGSENKIIQPHYEQSQDGKNIDGQELSDGDDLNLPWEAAYEEVNNEEVTGKEPVDIASEDATAVVAADDQTVDDTAVNEEVTNKQLTDEESPESVVSGGQGNPNLKEKAKKPEEIIDQEKNNMISGQDSNELEHEAEAGDSKNLQPDIGDNIKSDDKWQQQRPQTIVMPLFIIVCLIFLRLKYNANS
ncbi:MAG: hypothetical protein A4E53_02056 [Pelotomaculum sp. PtaB.Bin104]|nr:MAG: hypothetical protein A4E53_02056 [Pelotomaculum sp. PtaB.Bin104]